ncbi:MAG: DNA mismatch repair endonuclease MutL [Aquificaceae bacterium]
MHINLLPEEVKSKIASGEVIEGPAECVKELLENSLDAMATRIEVDIVKGGKRFIQVKDNGVGIPSEDIKKAILSGATSKIRGIEDLQNLNTYGFRGEALHAISLVSKLLLRSRFYQEEVGREIRVEAGKVVGERLVGMPVGTHVEVYELFYNLPVRRNFLKKEDVERKRIYKIVKTLALANPSVAFVLRAEGKEVLNLKPSNHLINRVEEVFDKRFEHISREEEVFKIDLFLSLEEGEGHLLFINKRPVYNKELLDFLKRSVGKKRLCLCYLWMPPYMIDVNIHPKKTEVKVQKEGKIKELIKESLGERHRYVPAFIKQKVKNYMVEPEFIGIIDKTIIVAKYGDYLYFFDQHLLSERYNYEVKGKGEESACKGAIKAGDEINERFAKELLRSWLNFENKEVCPHGRPLYYRVYLGDIYKGLQRNY